MADAQPTVTDATLPAPNKAQMQNEIASIDKSIHEALFYGGNLKLLMNNDPVLLQRGGSKGLAIYDDLERDAHCASVLGKRKRAVTAREWIVDPASEAAHDQEVADFVKETLENTRFDALCKDLLDAVLKGYAVAEVIWTQKNNRVVPGRFIARDQRRFTFDIHRRPRLLTQKAMLEGEELPDRKFIVHSVGGKDGTPFGRGLGHQLFWPVFFKRQGMTFWLIFADKFGSPTPVGKYPSGASEQEQRQLLQTLQGISQDGALIVPEDFEVELLEAARSGSSDAYERLCQYMDSEMSKAVLGETLTTTVGNTGGNRALGNVHDDIRMEVAKDDADDLCATLNDTLVKWLVDLNYPGSDYPEVWREFDEAEDLKTVSERDKTLKELGWERDEESFIDTYGEGYVRVATPEPNSPPAPGAAPTKSGDAAASTAASFSEAGFFARLRQLFFAEPGAVEQQRQRKRDDQEAIAQGAAQLAGNWEALLGDRVKQLQTVLDETGDLALFSERLQDMIDSEPDPKVVEALARATFASRLAGRASRGK